MNAASSPAEPPSFWGFILAAATMGILGFGGGWVVLGWIRRSFVTDRAWLTDAEFGDLASVAAVLPGTTAPNLLTLVGYRLGGVGWAVAAPAVFVLPSAVLVGAVAANYEKLRGIGPIMRLFDAMGTVVVGLVVAVALTMRRRAVTSALSAAIALAAFGALVGHVAGLVEVFVAAGLLGATTMRPPGASPTTTKISAMMLAPAGLIALPAATKLGLFWLFAKVGAVTFGGGYAMITAMHDEVVGRGWLDDKTFSDSIAIGQITPGPVALAGTFIGYRIGGAFGAVAATSGMFLPPLVLTVIVGGSLSRFRNSAGVNGALAGVGAAVVGVIAAAAWSLAQTSVRDAPALVIAMAACALMTLRPRLTPMVPLFGGGTMLVAYRWWLR